MDNLSRTLAPPEVDAKSGTNTWVFTTLYRYFSLSFFKIKFCSSDTDSLIFAHPENNNPLELGPHLGDLTDEYPQHHILEYCSGGAKQYGLKLKRKNGNDDYEYVLKVRGMTLNYDVMNNQNLRYETFKDTVINFVKNGDRDPICVIYPNFLRPSVVNSSVTSQPFHKMYKPFVGKGIIRPSDFSVLNFGHVSQ